MALAFTQVMDEKQVVHLAELANEVWHEHFISILVPEQIDYMVDKLQSVHAITDQRKSQGYQYFFLNLDGIDIGYTGIRIDGEKLFLSKLYILKAYRGKGYASEAFIFLEEFCQQRGLKAIWLTVNRFNENTIKVYEKKGFVTVRTQVADIGNGYVMDDYIMEKAL